MDFQRKKEAIAARNAPIKYNILLDTDLRHYKAPKIIGIAPSKEQANEEVFTKLDKRPLTFI